MRATSMVLAMIGSGFLTAFGLFFGVAAAIAQPVDWDTKGVQQVSAPLRNLSERDQQGILRRLGGKASDLVAMRIDTARGPIFLVQGVYRIGGICGANNCEFWILSSKYDILLRKVIQGFELQSRSHDGFPDLMTTMEGGAFDSSLSYWRFLGKRYVRTNCADAVYGDADGNIFKKAHITPHPCGTAG
jgi:hypothetical protein